MNARQATTWIGAGLGSIIVHIVAFIGLSWITAPEPVKNQPLPQSQINIQAQDVARVNAREQTAPTEALSETTADAPRAAQGVVPQSSAIAVAAQSTRAPNIAPSSDPLRAAKPVSTTRAASSLPSEQVEITPAPTELISAVTRQDKAVAAQDTPVKLTTALIPTATTIDAAALPVLIETAATTPRPTSKTTPAALPTSFSISAAPPALTKAAALPPPAMPGTAKAPVALSVTTATLPSTPTLEVPPKPAVAATPLRAASVAVAAVTDQALQAPSLPLPAVAGKAALAWSGDDEDQVASTSLAAIQAFMRPGDLGTSDSAVGDVRDGISTILASVPCSRLQTTFIPETGQLELRGHLPEDALRGPVLAALEAQVGDAIPVSDQLLLLPRPQCGALAGIADVGLPQSTEQLTNPRVIGEDGFAQNYTYFNGQRLELELVAPDYDSYVYVDFFTADGMVIHLQPNTIVPLEFASAKSPLSVGKDRGDKPSLDITVSPPFGQEIAAAFASSVPLYEGLRPLEEPAETYLAFLKDRVAIARASDPDFKGEWVYFFISTKEN